MSESPPRDLDALGASGFDYELPPELIAQSPAAERDGARLLVLPRDHDAELRHAQIRDLPGMLAGGDLLVVNRSRVVPARVRGHRPGGGSVELLLVAAVEDAPVPTWRTLARPARRLHAGQRLTIHPPSGDASAEVEVVGRAGEYTCVAFPAGTDVTAWAERFGEAPLPPYIRRPRGLEASDAERYQTIFAREPGSIAAPTAGLHLSTTLLEALRARGVGVAEVVLHVGPATFLAGRPGRSALAVEPEVYFVPQATRAAIAATRGRGRVIAVGTTTTRALESAARAGWPDTPQSTALVLAADAPFAVIDGLLTNFHLPGSSLLALVAAFAGAERVRNAYREAVAERYRFYSFGDAMLIL